MTADGRAYVPEARLCAGTQTPTGGLAREGSAAAKAQSEALRNCATSAANAA